MKSQWFFSRQRIVWINLDFYKIMRNNIFNTTFYSYKITNPVVNASCGKVYQPLLFFHPPSSWYSPLSLEICNPPLSTLPPLDTTHHPKIPDFFLIGIHSMQGWTATMRHGFTRKRCTKRLEHTGSLFKKNLQLKDVW